MVTLYEYVDQYQEILASLEATGGEIDEETEARLAALEGDLAAKVERTALVVLSIEGDRKAVQDEVARLQRVAKGLANQGDGLKSYLAEQLRRAGMKKVEGTLAKVGLRKNSRPSIRPKDPDFIPENYRKVVVAFDGARAYEDWLKGDLPDDDFLVDQGEHLRIW